MAARDPDHGGEAGALEVIEIADERTALADEAIALIERTFAPRDRHAGDELRTEIAEKRLGLIAPFDYHMLVAREGDAVRGVVIGAYLAGVNAGFVNYLAVAESSRGAGIGRVLRPALIARFMEDSPRAGHTGLNWVLGEVSAANPWLRRLVRQRGAIAFDLDYYHPGMRPGSAPAPYVLYRQPVADHRVVLPASVVRRLLYAIYRRGYRVRYPLQHPGFAAMMEQLEGRESVGTHAAFEHAPEPGETQDAPER